MESFENLFRTLPSIHALLSEEPVVGWLQEFDTAFITNLLRESLETFREEILQQKVTPKNKSHSKQAILAIAQKKLHNFLDSRLKRVVNGTGVVLHTNLGRAPLAKEVKEKLDELIEHYCSVEFDLESGKRGERTDIVEKFIVKLSGAEAAAVVNNNAAAVLLALNSLARGKEVVISRGQLIEIGGAFRIPEVMMASGAKMVEVGTTNKTHLRDYEAAIAENTGALMIAHPSNYRVLGFVKETPVQEIVALAHSRNIPVIYDLGGGVFIDLEQYGLPHEPIVSKQVELGVDVVTFSGDKILGGPQAGILVGKKRYIQKIRSNHLLRALRLDKLILASLEATLALYFKRDFVQRIPALRMLTETLEIQKERGETFLRRFKKDLSQYFYIDLVFGSSQVGSGAIPLKEIKSYVLKIAPISLSPNQLAKLLRQNNPPIIGYIRDEEFFLNLRTIREDELILVGEALKKIGEEVS